MRLVGPEHPRHPDAGQRLALGQSRNRPWNGSVGGCRTLDASKGEYLDEQRVGTRVELRARHRVRKYIKFLVGDEGGTYTFLEYVAVTVASNQQS